MKVDIKEIAFRLNEAGRRSDGLHIEDRIIEMVEQDLSNQLSTIVEQVISEMQELEHPKPSSVEEYNERYGLGEGE